MTRGRVGRALVRRIHGAPALLDVFAPSPPTAAPVRPEISLLLVCYGNLCRSPMAEGSFRRKLSDRGLLGRVTVASAGTAVTNPGRRPDWRARACMLRHGASIRDMRSRRISVEDFDASDLILAMDRGTRDQLLALARHEADRRRVRLLLDYTGGGEVRDPAALGPADFQRAYDAIERAADAVVDRLSAELAADRLSPHPETA